MHGPGRFCPHCGNTTPQKEVYEHKYDEEVNVVGSGPEAVDASYVVRVCGACDQVVLYHRYMDIDESESLVYPEMALGHQAPRAIHKVYREALRVRRASPSAFAALLRKGLEQACREKGAEGRTLEQRIESLARRGELPSIVMEASHVIRHLGNQGAHDDKDVTEEEAEAMDAFFQFVMHYLYVMHPNLELFRDRVRPSRTE